MKRLLLLFLLAPLFAFGQTESEPNESFNTSNSVTFGSEVEGFIGVTLDQDYFSFSVSQSGVIEFRLLQEPTDVELRVFLFNTGREEIQRLISPSSDGSVFEVSVCATGTYYLFFSDRNSGTNQGPDFNADEPYKFRVDFMPFAGVDDCECENESFNQACEFEIGDEVEGLIVPWFDTAPYTPDRDYHEFEITQAGIITFNLLQEPTSVELRTFLFNPAREEIQRLISPASGGNSFEVSVCEPGTYYLFLSDRNSGTNQGPDFNSAEQYKFRVDFTPFLGIDDCECENESFNQACEFEIGDEVEGLIVPWFDTAPYTPDLDYHQFEITQPGIIIFNLLQEPTDVELRTFLFNPDREEIQRLISPANGGNSFEVSVCETGTYYLFLSDRNSGTNQGPDFNSEEQYKFRVDFLEYATIEPNECTDNSFSGATPFAICDTMMALLSPGTDESSGGSDIDYFSINLEADTSYNIVVNDIPSGLDLRLQVFDANEVLVTNEISGSSSNPINFFFEPDVTGLYYLRIRERNGRSDVESPYTLQVGCNQTTSTPAPQQLTAANLYPNPANDVLTIDLTGLAINNAQIQLLDLQGRKVLEQKLNNSIIDINLTDVPAGTYFVRVISANKQYTGQVVRR